MGVASAAARGGMLHGPDAQDAAPLELENANFGMVNHGIKISCASLSISNRGCGAINGAVGAAAADDAAAACSASDDASCPTTTSPDRDNGGETFGVPTVRGLSDAVVCICGREGVPRALWCEHGAGVLPSAPDFVCSCSVAAGLSGPPA